MGQVAGTLSWHCDKNIGSQLVVLWESKSKFIKISYIYFVSDIWLESQSLNKRHRKSSDGSMLSDKRRKPVTVTDILLTEMCCSSCELHVCDICGNKNKLHAQFLSLINSKFSVLLINKLNLNTMKSEYIVILNVQRRKDFNLMPVVHIRGSQIERGSDAKYISWTQNRWQTTQKQFVRKCPWS